MLVIAAGVPCRWTAWAFEALKLIARLKGASLRIEYVDRLDALEPTVEGDCLFLSMYPNRSLARIAAQPGVRFLLFRETAVSSVRYVTGSGLSFVEALRTVGASCALIEGLVRARKPIDVSGVPAERSADLLKWFGRVVGMEIDDAAAGALLVQLGPIPKPDNLLVSGFEGAQAAMISDVLGPLYDQLTKIGVLRVTWPTGVFLSGDRPDTSAELITEITGAARILYYGPYFHLPAGHWEARATIGFSADAAGTPFSIEAHSSTALGSASFLPKKPGMFEVKFGFAVIAPEQPVEVRLRTDRGAIEGRVSLIKLDLVCSNLDEPLNFSQFSSIAGP